MSKLHRGPGLRGRHSECEALDRLLEGVRAGQSRVLVVRGEAGVGKTALLEYLLERASKCRIARAAGVESEMELAFAGCNSWRPRLRWTGKGARDRGGGRERDNRRLLSRPVLSTCRAALPASLPQVPTCPEKR
jgi:hypothetical protein